MADCPKCGRLLSVAGTCIKCGTVQDRSKWYAIADEQEEEERKQPQSSGKRPRAAVSAKRNEWYAAAGEEAPPVDEAEDRAAAAPGQVPTSGELHDWAEVSRGRKDPPFVAMGIGAVVLIAVAGLVWYAKHISAAPDAEPTVNLPRKVIIKNHSYGFEVVPPDGFKQQVVPQPDFARGAHGELTSMVFFHEPASGIEAYYFGEIKRDSNLDTYANIQVSDLGKLTPLTAVPDGMKDYPTKGYLIDMGARKALVYVSFAKPDRYLSVWVLAPSGKFSAVQAQVESAARAFSIFVPDGPHPDKMMIQGEPE